MDPQLTVTELRRLLDRTRELLLVFDLTGAIRYASPAWEPVLGRDQGSIEHAGVAGLVHPHDRPRLDDAIRTAIGTGGATGGTVVRLLHADGTARVVVWEWELDRPSGLVLTLGRAVAAEVVQRAGARSGAAKAADTGLRRSVERIIEGSAFEPHFQPIVRLSDRRIVGFEALTRFDDGTGPDARFADARRVGLAPELEVATIAAAMRASEALPHGAALHMNVSPARLLDTPELPALIAGARRPVVIELTEHEAIGDYRELRDAIAGLGNNVAISVDDAGSGYSSLRHIQALSPASVKLDRHWVVTLESDPAIRALVAGLVEFGRQMRCEIIGEGVETDAQDAALRSLGVDFGQGFLYGRPSPATAWRVDPVAAP